MLRHISIGPAALQTAPLIYLIGFFLLTEIARRRAEQANMNAETVTNALTLGLIGGVISARLAYVALHWRAYHDNLSESLALNLQGLSLEAGLIIGTAIAIGYATWRGIAWRTFLDTLAPAIGVLVMLIPLGFLANGDVIGQPADVPWAIELWNEARHPVQLYAVTGSVLTLIAWYLLRETFQGAGILIIVAGTAITWLLVGFLLAEPALIANYRAVQVGSWLMLIVVSFVWSLWEPELSE